MSIRIIVQKSGRLSSPSFSLLEKCGYYLGDNPNRLKYHFDDLEVLLLRDDDIPRFVSQGVCDLGIVGFNQVREFQLSHHNSKNHQLHQASNNSHINNNSIQIVHKLDFSHCRLSLAVPNGSLYTDLSWFAKKTIATSYPNCVKDFFRKNNIDAQVVYISGSVETAPFLGIADGVCDLVATGSTLIRHNLKEVHQIFMSCAVVIAKNFADDRETFGNSIDKDNRIKSLLQRIVSVSKAQSAKYVMMNAPKSKVDEIVKLIPGLEKPSIMDLYSNNPRSNKEKNHHDQTVAIHVVASEPVFWSTIEKLKAYGASSILVVPIEKIID